MRDIVNHYRTLIAEGLDHVYYHETFEFLGTRIDDAAGRLARRVRPPRPESPAPSLEGWQPMGWVDETADFRAFPPFPASVMAPFHAYLDDMTQRLYVGPTSSEVVGALFKPKVDQAEKMREAMQPMLEKLGEVLGDPDKVEWRAPEIRTAEAVANAQESIRTALNIKPFDVTATPDEIYGPAFENIQSWVNKMVRDAEIAEFGFMTTRFVAGLDPEAEWIDVSKERIEERLTAVAESPYEGAGIGSFYGIPLYAHPDDKTMLRMRREELVRNPHWFEILEALSDLDGTVEDNPTT